MVLQGCLDGTLITVGVNKLPSIIKADDGVISGVTGITSTADNSGTLEFQATSGIVDMDLVVGALNLPTGTTAQRPASPQNGQIRYNTTLAVNEIYQGGQWVAFASGSASSVSYLVIAGGGGANTGAGGAGGYIESTLAVVAGVSNTITVGAGGTGVQTGQTPTAGSNSVFASVTAIGGGRGGRTDGGDPLRNGGSGGSGGGGGGDGNGSTGGSGTAGQGNAGGGASSGSPYPGGGGGGASAAGAAGSGSQGGAGGAGTASSISGSSVTRAGGGGGGGAFANALPGAGGAGGGGAGGTTGGANGTSGTVNTGGGGGGFVNYNQPYVGGSGGSGVVIISYPTSFKIASATGTYSLVSSGGNYIFTFTGSGTITF